MAKTANFKIYNGTSWEELTFPPSSHNHDSTYLKIATAKREYASLIPYGTQIPANADLNTTTYIKVGNYYCSANTTVKTLKNCPTTKGFMMQVLSPLATTIDNETTKTYVYRLRKIQTYTGEEYIQYVSSGATAGTFTYGAWKQTARTADLSGYASLSADNEFEGQIYCISDIYSETNIHAEGSIISDYELKTENTDGYVSITPGIVDITFADKGIYLSAEEDLIEFYNEYSSISISPTCFYMKFKENKSEIYMNVEEGFIDFYNSNGDGIDLYYDGITYKNGTNMYEIKFPEQSGTLAMIDTVTSLPTPTEKDRGKLMILAGTSTDELYICLKISNAYTWVKMSSEDAIYNSLLNDTYGN